MDVTTLDISRSLCDTCQIYNAAVYESLLRATEDGTLEPLLAESWEANADNTEFTFTLNTDAVFSDGSPVVIEAVSGAPRPLAGVPVPLAGAPVLLADAGLLRAVISRPPATLHWNPKDGRHGRGRR